MAELARTANVRVSAAKRTDSSPRTGQPRPRSLRPADSETAERGAVNRTWLGMTLAQSRRLWVQLAASLGATVGIFKWYDTYFKPFYDNHPAIALVIVVAIPLYLLIFSIGPQIWRRRHQAKREAITLTKNLAANRKHFRLDPYVTATPDEFRREDDAHNEALRWIRDTTRPVLFLSGVSGSGKSSVLEAYVLPRLRAEGWRIELVRSFADPLPPLEAVLDTPRQGTPLLVVFDQFEEFVILEDRTSAEERRRFLVGVRELQQAPPPGLCILFSFRRDYMSDVIAMQMGDLIPGQTFIEIDAFRRDAARRFLEGAPDKPGPDLVDRLLKGAEALDDVPARFRPITLNMLGLALQDFDRQVTGRPDRLVQGYMEAAITQPEIREIAPHVVEQMITEANTKKPRTVAELAAETKLGDHDVLACLVLLARRGLVRQLDTAQNLWEISHDFVARQFAILLGRLRPSPWPKVAMNAAPALFILVLFGVAVGIPWHIKDRAFSELRALRVPILLDPETHALSAEFREGTDDQTLASALPYLIELRVSAIYLSNSSKVTRFSALPSSLQTLELIGTNVSRLPPLPSSLETLNLKSSRVRALPATLPTNLQTLDLTSSDVTALPATLPSSMKSLYLGGTYITTLPPLPNGLQSLTLNEAVTALPTTLPNSLQTLDLSYSQVTMLPTTLPNSLKYLSLRDSAVSENDRALAQARNRGVRIDF